MGVDRSGNGSVGLSGDLPISDGHAAATLDCPPSKPLVKFNPLTGQLYTNAGVPIKKLNCPDFRQWNELFIDDNAGTRHCAVCKRSVVDTQGLTDADVVFLVNRDASTCLKVNLSQDNVRVVNINV